MRRVWTPVWSMAAGTALVLAAAGCGGGSSGGDAAATSGASAASTSGAITQDAAAAKLVPASIRSKGQIVVASDATYPPVEYIGSDGSTVIGLDPDLAAAIGKVLGITMVVKNVTFDSIIPGIQAGKYDVGMSGFNDTKEREKVVDFVDYYNGGSSFFTKAGGPKIASLADLCGQTVSVESGTTQQDDIKTQSAACVQAGKQAVKALVYPTQTAVNLALSSSRATVSIADSPVSEYEVQQSHGTFVISGKPYGAALHGIAVSKGSTLTQAFAAAVKDLIADGEYTKILTKWHVQDEAITTPSVNAATS